ncbi:MAG TPA: DUF2442 domain-containing protein [Pyrinomonadaceae bacterium]|jgi:hypothetical protein
MIKIVGAEYLRDYVLWLKFSDGVEGELDLKDELHGEIFEPLKDKEYFQQFVLKPDWLTISWPNGADFAPEFLYSAIKVHV